MTPGIPIGPETSLTISALADGGLRVWGG